MSLEIAYSLMREYHATQVDKSGEPYYLHPERVGATVQHLGPEYAAAGYLHDIGIKESERKYNSSAAQYQEEEGPPIAREILGRLGAKAELIDEVCVKLLK